MVDFSIAMLNYQRVKFYVNPQTAAVLGVVFHGGSSTRLGHFSIVMLVYWENHLWKTLINGFLHL